MATAAPPVDAMTRLQDVPTSFRSGTPAHKADAMVYTQSLPQVTAWQVAGCYVCRGCALPLCCAVAVACDEDCLWCPCFFLGVPFPSSWVAFPRKREGNAWLIRDKQGRTAGHAMLVDAERGTLACYGMDPYAQPKCWCTRMC